MRCHLSASTPVFLCLPALFLPFSRIRIAQDHPGRQNTALHPRTDFLDCPLKQVRNQPFYSVFFTISFCVPIASVVMICPCTFRLSRSSGIAVISFDLSSTRLSAKQKPFSSTALTMWFPFCSLLPFPRCVLPSRPRILRTFSPSLCVQQLMEPIAEPLQIFGRND